MNTPHLQGQIPFWRVLYLNQAHCKATVVQEEHSHCDVAEDKTFSLKLAMLMQVKLRAEEFVARYYDAWMMVCNKTIGF